MRCVILIRYCIIEGGLLLHLIWLVPAVLFFISFYQEPRRLVNAYLLTLTLFLVLSLIYGNALTPSGPYVQGSWLRTLVLWIFPIISLLSVLSSTLYLILSGRKLLFFEGYRFATLFTIGFGLLLSLYLFIIFYFKDTVIPSHILIFPNFLLLYITGLYVSYMVYSVVCHLFRVEREPDCLIILGSGLIRGEVTPLLAQRLDEGYQLYLKYGKRPKLLVSGGLAPDSSRAEAEAMASYLMLKGVLKEDIIVENQSKTTYENLLFSKTILEDLGHKAPYCLVVTNSFHALRAGVYLRKLGLQGHSIGSKTALYYLPNAWIREGLGLVAIYWKWHLTIVGLAFLAWVYGLLI